MAARLELAAVVVDGNATPASDQEVDALEAELGITMPAGYREYVTTLGGGDLDILVRVLPPDSIRGQLDEHRARLATAWFWGDSIPGFTQDAAMESIPIADTLDGDSVVAWPGDPSRLFVLPRHSETGRAVAADLLWLVEWICAGGLGHLPSDQRVFTPWDDEYPGFEDGVAGRVVVELEPTPPPDLSGSPREVLLAYFAELAEVETWAWPRQPDPDAPWDGSMASDRERFFAEWLARSVAVHGRFGTSTFAGGHRGVTVTASELPEHAAEGIRILEETALGPGRVRIQAVIGLICPKSSTTCCSAMATSGASRPSRPTP